MKFKIGDKVQLIDGLISGIIVHLEKKKTTIIDQDGFSRVFFQKDLILIRDQNSIKLDVRTSTSNEITEKKGLFSLRQSKKKKIVVDVEIDLHIEKITGNYFYMNNAQMLEFQINFFKKQLNKAIKNNIKNIVFIHGKGSGVLKYNIIKELEKYNDVHYSDASFLDYGEGATLVVLQKRN